MPDPGIVESQGFLTDAPFSVSILSSVLAALDYMTCVYRIHVDSECCSDLSLAVTNDAIEVAQF